MRGPCSSLLFLNTGGEIGSAINNDVDRGCTVIEARGFYTGKKVGMLFVIARRSEAHSIYQVIDEIDPNAFVSQGAVNGVYGMDSIE